MCVHITGLNKSAKSLYNQLFIIIRFNCFWKIYIYIYMLATYSSYCTLYWHRYTGVTDMLRIDLAVLYISYTKIRSQKEHNIIRLLLLLLSPIANITSL